jgi:AcrR family transcriptional regulator
VAADVSGASQPSSKITRGRPRDPERERAIVDATLALLAEVGYEQLSLEAVAGRARASRATIYRRWAGKRELVAAAVKARAPSSVEFAVDTGSLRGDLLVLCRHLTDTLSGFDGRFVLGLLRAALDDPVLGEALEVGSGPTGARLPGDVLSRAIARGELPAEANPFAYEEVTGAVLILRVINRQPVDEVYLERLVDDVLIPALTHAPSSPYRTTARALFSGASAPVD